MDEDIEFLRELGQDLKSLARRQPRVTRQRGRAILAVAPILLVLVVGVLWFTLSGRASDGLRDSSETERSGGVQPEPDSVFGPVPVPTGQMLQAVDDGAGPSDVWAVGTEYGGPGGRQESLILHWDGSSWRENPHPDVGELWGVLALPSGDAWAVGGDDKILRWDGSSWSSIDLPHVKGMTLYAIDGSGPRDVWAAGTRYGARWEDDNGDSYVGTDTLTLHWDGVEWEIVPSPNVGPRTNYVHGVVALSPDNAWAVGYSRKAGLDHAMTMHWNGKSWAFTRSPNPGKEFNVLWGIGDDGQGGTWAVGHYGEPLTALYLRWVAGEWEVVPAPTGKPLHQTPTSLSGTSADDVWAVGSEPTSSFLVARWNGSDWEPMNAELPEKAETWSAWLGDVVAISSSDAWAVGRYQEGTSREGKRRMRALILRWDGTSWQAVPIPMT
jgi:hypothetical protein